MDLLGDIGTADQLTSGKILIKIHARLPWRAPILTTLSLLPLLSSRTVLARTENAVLSAKVKELTEKVKELTLENAALLAEVEMYRKEAALPNFSKLALGQASPSNMMDTEDNAMTTDDFVRAGNGVRASCGYWVRLCTLYTIHVRSLHLLVSLL